MLTPKHSGAAGERQTLINGNSARLAAVDFKNNLLNNASQISKVSIDSIDVLNDRIIDINSGETIVFLKTLAAMALPGKIMGLCEYLSPPTYPLVDSDARSMVSQNEYRNYPSYAYTTQVALIEVDTQTGKVKVLKVIAAHDVGVAINPQKIEGQIEGSLLMGQGYTLSEEYRMENGMPKSRTIKDLGLPTIKDMPEMQVIIVEDPEPEGPFGAKGISEVATVPYYSPQFSIAIYDAIGKRVYKIPARPEDILALLNN